MYGQKRSDRKTTKQDELFRFGRVRCLRACWQETKLIHGAATLYNMRMCAGLLVLLFLAPFELEGESFLFESARVSVWRAPSSGFRGAQEINVTALRLEGKTVVIDPGVERWRDDLLAVFPVIDEIWITHAHPDHAALSGVLPEGCGVVDPVLGPGQGDSRESTSLPERRIRCRGPAQGRYISLVSQAVLAGSAQVRIWALAARERG